jgi:integrase
MVRDTQSPLSIRYTPPPGLSFLSTPRRAVSSRAGSPDGLRMGLHGEVVQTRLGHAHISTTLDVYTDALLELDEEAANLLDADPETENEESTATTTDI